MREPDRELGDPQELLLGYLDTYRAAVARKLDGLSEAELRSSRLPSGWTPLGMLKHLVYMERRWLVWGFLAEPVPDPWGDRERDEVWYTDPPESRDELLAALTAGGARTRAIAGGADLAEPGRVGGRFGPASPPATLGWILHHVLQEYARHMGHLDVARELIDRAVGE